VSVTDAGGDGSLSYDNTTGVITFTGVSAAETQAHFTGGTGVTYNAGSISIGQDVATTANVTFASVNAAISGDLTGDVLSADGLVTVLDGGTDGTDATFTGDVTGNVSGNAGTVTNGVYTTSSVTALSDVTSAGSGEIITGAERTKLNGIEALATADQTDAEIKTAYENNANTNAFEDADETKLDGIEALATADQTDAEIKTAYENNANTNAFEDADETKLDGIEALATADQTDAEIKTAYENNANTNAFEDADETKLDGIEALATADQTDAEIKTAYENNANTNAFEDADETKLDGIEASADVTDATNVEAAGALMDSEVTDLAGVKAVTISTLQVKPSEGAFADGDKTKLDGIEDSADVTDATNVEAAGALMDSEVTDLAGIKAVTISTLQVKPSEGPFADGDKTKLDGIEDSADVTDATNVAAAGAVMNTGDETIAGTKTFSSAIASTVTTGTAPFTVASTTVVANLNADQLDGQEGSYYTDFSNQVVDGGEVTNGMVADDLTISGGTVNNTPIGATSAAAADVTALIVEDAAIINESRDEAGDVFTIYDDGVGSVMTVSTTTGVHISDLTLNDSFSLTGSMSASSYTTTAGDPTNDNHLARKAYVDAQIAANMTTAHVYSCTATASTIAPVGNGTEQIYYLNGSNVFYKQKDGSGGGDSFNADRGYTFTVTGTGLTGTTNASLWLRGIDQDLSAVATAWNVTNDSQATFGLTYNEVVAITTASSAGTQNAGGMILDLVLEGKHTGVQLHFHLDDTNDAPDANTFN